MPQRIELQKELKNLHKDLLKMGTIIEQSIDDAIDALKNQDVKLAQEVIDKDDIIDKMEATIEAECIMIIARQQPIASDLRLITSVLKMITDLERIADHCADISEYTIKLANATYLKPLEHIPMMAEQVKKMVRMTIDGYVEQNIEKANQVCEEDDIVDKYFYGLVGEIQQLMQQKPEFVVQGTYFLFIIKYLERMADHATNISEWIIFNVTGKHRSFNNNNM